MVQEIDMLPFSLFLGTVCKTVRPMLSDRCLSVCLEAHPIFGPRLLWLNGCMDQDATWYGGRPRPTRMWIQLPPEKRAHPTPHPIFGPCLLWPNGWMDEDAAWYGSIRYLSPGHIVPDGVPAPTKGAQQPRLFGPCLLWPLSPISATAELLFYVILNGNKQFIYENASTSKRQRVSLC